MRRGFARVVMAVIGLGSLVLYASAAWILYRLFRIAWAGRPSAGTILAVFVGATLLGGFLSYRFGGQRLLAHLDAVELTSGGSPRVFERLDALCERMGLARPRILVADVGDPNAFAVGGDGGAVVLDASLFDLLSGDELEAVLAHELGHLEARDSLVQVLAFSALQTVVGVAVLALLPLLLVVTGVAKADAWIRGDPRSWTRTFAGRVRTLVVVLLLVVPTVITLVLFAHSRRREIAADDRAADVTGDPLALARALRKIDAAATARLALRGVVVPDGEDPMLRLLATHPAVARRIERLEARATS